MAVWGATWDSYSKAVVHFFLFPVALYFESNYREPGIPRNGNSNRTLILGGNMHRKFTKGNWPMKLKAPSRIVKCRKGHLFTPANVWVFHPKGEKPLRACKTCRLAYREKYSKERRREIRAAMYIADKKRNPRGNAARAAVNYAVRKGVLVKPTKCEMATKTSRCSTWIEAHHDDYEKQLEVQWLCRIHHRATHYPQMIKNRPK